MKKFDDYKGLYKGLYKLVYELDFYKAFNTKFAMNIASYNEDGFIQYVRRSDFNTATGLIDTSRDLTKGIEPTRISI